MSSYHEYIWKPIEDLPDNWKESADPDIPALIEDWKARQKNLLDQKVVDRFHDELNRKWAIETGILERLYSLSESATKTWIKYGIDAELIGDGDTDLQPRIVERHVKDQLAAIEGLYQFVSDQRSLQTSYIKELHCVITEHQEICAAIDSLGRLGETELLKGEYKKWPNNIVFDNGTKFEFCPPEQVAGQMEQLVKMHLAHEDAGVPPDVTAAWLHHRFVLIHPFHDGNGRTARCLATLVLLKASWLPLVVERNDRADYIQALREADKGDIVPLVRLFGRMQKRELAQAAELANSITVRVAEIGKIAENLSSRIAAQKNQADKRIKELVNNLLDQAYRYIKELSTELNRRNPELTTVQSEEPGAPRSSWFHWQIGQCAKELKYFAKPTSYSAWVRLMGAGDPAVEILLSFHGWGKSGQTGACSAMFYLRAIEDYEAENKSRRVTDLIPLCSEPFLISPSGEKDITKRFARWLDDSIKRGLDRWDQMLP